MPNKSITMNKLRQVLRLHSQGKGTKSIASFLSMSRTTVKKYLSRFKDSGMSLEEVLSLADKDLSGFLQEKEIEFTNEHLIVLEKLLPVYCKRLKRKGVTREMLYREYKERYPEGVSKSSKYEAVINNDFADFADQYGFSVIPTRAYRPRDKALVEGAVKLIYRSIYLRLEERIFHDFKTLNASIRVALEVHNNAPFCGRSYSRRDQFEEIERMTLGRLNPIAYELKTQSVVTVMKNGHVRLGEDAHYYSVPCKYIGKKVKLLYTSSVIEVFYRYEKIAEHLRSYSRFHYTTDQDHLASHHRAYTEWSAEKFISEAIAIHPDVGTYITKVIENKAHPEQAYKSVQGILSFARRVGEKRLINACRWADSYGLYNYPAIESILINRQDEVPLEEDVIEAQSTPIHKNIRGKEYYS